MSDASYNACANAPKPLAEDAIPADVGKLFLEIRCLSQAEWLSLC